jgi:RNA polymerase sigma factor (sigma-70 family)
MVMTTVKQQSRNDRGLSPRQRERIDCLLRQEIGFIHNAEFEFLSPDQFEEPAFELFATDERGRSRQPGLGSGVLLTPQGEAFLFRKYNYLKFRANALRSLLDHRSKSTKLVSQIERLLNESMQARELIASANLRLVASIARRYSRNDHEFDELSAEGALILLRAIEKFDCSRGFRFSTYATHSIQRHFFRVLKRRQRTDRRELTGHEHLNSTPARDEAPVLDGEASAQLNQIVARWGECLSEREQQILRARFGLGSSDEPRTLKSISRDVDLSKERVRQIQMRALQKLREFAAAEELTVEVA